MIIWNLCVLYGSTVHDVDNHLKTASRRLQVRHFPDIFWYLCTSKLIVKLVRLSQEGSAKCWTLEQWWLPQCVCPDPTSTQNVPTPIIRLIVTNITQQVLCPKNRHWRRRRRRADPNHSLLSLLSAKGSFVTFRSRQGIAEDSPLQQEDHQADFSEWKVPWECCRKPSPSVV